MPSRRARRGAGERPWASPRTSSPRRRHLVRDLANPAGVDRRSAFTNLVGEVGDIASGQAPPAQLGGAAGVLRAPRARAGAGASEPGRTAPSSTTSCPMGLTKKDDAAEAPDAAGSARARARASPRACRVVPVRDRLRALHGCALLRGGLPHGRAAPRSRTDGIARLRTRATASAAACARTPVRKARLSWWRRRPRRCCPPRTTAACNLCAGEKPPRAAVLR